MEHALAVGMVKRLGDLPYDARDFVQGQLFPSLGQPLQPGFQGLAIDELHHHIV